MAKKKNKSPLLLFRKRLRDQTAYDTARSIITGTTLLNSIIAGLSALLLLSIGSYIAAAVTASTLFLWLLLNTIGHAFLDLADAHLHQIHRQAQSDSLARNQNELE